MQTSTLHTSKLPPKRLSVLKQRARDLGLTPEQYLQKLIDDDLAISAKAKSTPLSELAAPFQKALAGVSEEELNRRVKAARSSK